MSRDHEKRRLGDRRGRPRFEIVGDLAGTLEATVPLRVRDVGSGGALFESPVGLPPGSVHRLAYEIDGVEALVDARVCHLRVLSGTRSDPAYLLGVEFLRSHPALAEAIEQCLDLEARPADGSGV